MKIGFYAGDLVPFDSETLDQRPLGGTETGVIRLADALAELGHEILVFNQKDHPSVSNGKVRYLPLAAVQEVGSFDVFIAIRDWIPLMIRVDAKVRMLWTGEAHDQFSNFGIGDPRVVKLTDTLLTVSAWQSKKLAQTSGFPIEKTWVLGNGIHEPWFSGSEPRARKRLIYSSTPHRGLAYIPDLYQALKKWHPELELKIFSSFKVYDRSGENDQEHLFANLKNRLQAFEGCSFSGSILQKDLAREFMRSSILFYPCDYEETSCITAMEAQAAGAVVLSSDLGALSETVGDAGILIPGRPSQGMDYLKAYVTAADKLLKDDQLWSHLSKRGIERAKEFTWTRVAKRFDSFLNQKIENA